MSYHKYPTLTAPRLHQPRARAQQSAMFSEPRSDRACFHNTRPLLIPYCKVKPDQATPEPGVNGRLCPRTVRSFSFHKQVHPEGDGAFMLEVLVQDGRGLRSMKQLRCFNRNVRVASSTLNPIATSGRLITGYKV